MSYGVRNTKLKINIKCRKFECEICNLSDIASSFHRRVLFLERFFDVYLSFRNIMSCLELFCKFFPYWLFSDSAWPLSKWEKIVLNFRRRKRGVESPGNIISPKNQLFWDENYFSPFPFYLLESVADLFSLFRFFLSKSLPSYKVLVPIMEGLISL